MDEKSGLDLEKLDFAWVDKTNDLSELNAALNQIKVSQTPYVQLQRAVEEKIEFLNPNS